MTQNVRLRSANRGNGYNTWNVNSSGNVNTNNAINAWRVAPIVCVWIPKKPARSAGEHLRMTQGAELPPQSGENNIRLTWKALRDCPL